MHTHITNRNCTDPKNDCKNWKRKGYTHSPAMTLRSPQAEMRNWHCELQRCWWGVISAPLRKSYRIYNARYLNFNRQLLLLRFTRSAGAGMHLRAGARTWQGTLAVAPALPPETAADPAHRSRYFLSCQRIIGMGHQGHVVAASKRFDESCINPTPQANSRGSHRLRTGTTPDQETSDAVLSLPCFQAGWQTGTTGSATRAHWWQPVLCVSTPASVLCGCDLWWWQRQW